MKWDEDEEEEELLRNFTSTEITAAPAAIEQTAELSKVASEFHEVETEMQVVDPAQQDQQVQDHLNAIVGWMSGVEVLDVTNFPSKLIYKLRLTTYLSGERKEYTCVTVWFDKVESNVNRKRGRNDTSDANQGSWQMSVIKVQGEHCQYEDVDGKQFDDILEYAVETNDLSFLLREIHARVQSLTC